MRVIINGSLAGVVHLLTAGLLFSTGFRGHAADYSHDVKLLLEKRCYSCHGRLKQKAELRLDAGALILKGAKEGPIVKPFNSAESVLIKRVSSHDSEERMPPEGKPLAPEEIKILSSWIDAGAAFPSDEKIPSAPHDHWAFQPVTRPIVPAVRSRGWVRNPIDSFVLSRLDERGIKPASPASSGALLRRAHLDLIGLPPTIEEQVAFMQRAPERALDEAINGLLARPEYGERWARHWLDVVRYADSNGYERDAAKPFVWRYRDYVIGSLNADKPYNQFVTEQIAGDQVPDATAKTIVATGYFRLGHWDDEPADPEADRYDQLDDMVATTSEAFLGLTLACARCHDHKFEPLSTRDYYSLLSIFSPLQRPTAGRTELALSMGSPEEIGQIQKRDAQIALMQKEIRAIEQGFQRELLERGKSKLSPETVTALLLEREDRSDAQKALVVSTAKAWDQEWQSAIPGELKEKISEKQNRISNLRRVTPDLPQGYFMREASTPPATHILLRGNPTRPGAEVSPAVPAILVKAQPAFESEASSGKERRLAFARWLASTNSPLTARVIVNRIWQQHFGVGLVRTSGDFGLMGEPPTNPELLDWLASWFANEGAWSLKGLHRLILGSATWRASRSHAEATDLDPDNRLLSYQSYRRLEVEAIRDSILAVSGRLNRSMFGPAIYPTIPPAALEANTDKESVWKASNEIDRSRRAVYAFIKRGLVVPMFEVFDLADTVHCTSRRQVTTVAPQALTLFNGDFANEQARHLARRLFLEAGPERGRQIDYAYRLALARSPSEKEKSDINEFLDVEMKAAHLEHGDSDSAPQERALVQFCRVLFNLNEFVYPE